MNADGKVFFVVIPSAEFRHYLTQVLMFSDQETFDIMKLLAAILHLGNVEFEGKVLKRV